MFRCEVDTCNKVCEPRQPQHSVVTHRRQRQYEKKIRRGPNKGEVELVNGWEIAKEVKVCPECYKELTGEEPTLAPPLPQVQKIKEKLNNNRRYKPWRHRNHNNNQSRKGPKVDRVNKSAGDKVSKDSSYQSKRDNRSNQR